MIKNLKTKDGVRLLSDNYIGHLAFISEGGPYIIPITYYYDEDSNSIISYSSEGHKVKAMRKNSAVSLAVDEIESVSEWQSVLVHGQYEEIGGSDAKYCLHQFAEGVKKVIANKEKQHPQFISEFSSKLYSDGIPIVYRIKVIEMTGKERKR